MITMPDLTADLPGLLAHLQKRNLPHLQVSLSKPHLTLYIEKDGAKQNCCPFTLLWDLQYRLSKAELNDLWKRHPSLALL